MKKFLLLFSIFVSYGMAHQVTADITDEYRGVQSVAGLHFHINNAENVTRSVRIGYLFFAQEGQKFYIDRKNGCPDKNIPGIEDATIGLYDTNNGRYVLDVMLDMPQGTKDFCIVLRDNYGSVRGTNFKDEFIINWDMGVDGEYNHFSEGETPLDNAITYNYINKRVDGKRRPGSEFLAKTIYADGDQDSKYKKLSEEERFNVWEVRFYKNVPVKTVVDLGIKSFGAYKDTRMLMASFGGLVDQYRWNESTFDGHINQYTSVEEREIFIGRCWAIAVFNMYSYFMGNRNTIENALTQDEMIYIAKNEVESGDARYDIFEPNNSQGGQNSTAVGLINKIMFGANATAHSPQDEPLGGPEIYNFIKEGASGKGRPLYISVTIPNVGRHALLIDGLAVTQDSKRDTLVHLVNLDNFGNESYMYLSCLKKHLDGYLTYDIPNGFRFTDVAHPVDADSDGDGVVDFDEYYRFETDENKYSTDDNGISDLVKIYENTANWYMNYRWPSQVSRKTQSNGEPLELVDIPQDIALYALNYVSLNDRVGCYDRPAGKYPYSIYDSKVNLGCGIASEGPSGTRSVRLGVSAFANDIYSKSDVLLRSRARVGNIVLYRTSGIENKIETQGTLKDQGKVFYPKVEMWPYNVRKKVDPIGSLIGTEQKIVKNGETFVISGEDGHNNFAFLKVEGGGKLVIGTGDVYVGSIQLESGSTFMFDKPAYETVLHINGNIIWRGKYVENPDASSNSPAAVARGFKLVQHSNADVMISSVWQGAIVAPYSMVVIGQEADSKKVYGQILANKIVIHQNTDVYRVVYAPYAPVPQKKQGKVIALEKDAMDGTAPDMKFIGANRDEINFVSTTAGDFDISIMKPDGSTVRSFTVTRSVSGSGTVNWNSSGVPNGMYIISVRHNGKTSGKVVILK
jgi:hypothetical protein